MSHHTAQEHLDDYLSDAHSIEEQALVQMKRASKIAGDRALADIFARHEAETEQHEQLVRERMAAHDAKPSAIKEAVMKMGGVAFVLFAKANPDTPGKLTAHGYSYEHLEIGSYELLARVAQRAGDLETVAVAGRILEQERAMAQRLEEHFDDAVEASLRDLQPDDMRKQVAKYLADAHALETQAISLLEGGQKIVGDDRLAALMEEHLAETREHERLTRERLEALGESPSRLKDAALGMGGLNWGGFFAAHPDTPGKLAAFAYAFEHLEIAGYELLKRVARRAGDEATVAMAERILTDERGAAEKIAADFDHAAEAALAAQAG
jgi:ferritin-like metal-binding protein YciE